MPKGDAPESASPFGMIGILPMYKRNANRRKQKSTLQERRIAKAVKIKKSSPSMFFS